MELTHRLTYNANTTVIDEPIGFDDLQMTIKRNDYHGMGAEMSLGELEFYGLAHNIIKSAYDADIDTEVIYEVTDEANNTIYSGNVDLTTCSFLNGDYQSVKTKIGDVGSMTTFNNRTGIEIDMNEPRTVDGNVVDDVNWLDLHVPIKHLLYTNSAKQKSNNTITTSGGYNSHPETGIEIHDTGAPFIFIPIGDNINAEFGQFANANPYGTSDRTLVDPQYVASEDHTSKYGTNTKAIVDIHLDATLVRKDNGWSPCGQNYIRWCLEAIDSQGNVITGEEHNVYKPDVNFNGATWDISCDLKGELNAGGSVKYYLKFTIDLGTATSQYFWCHITVNSDSYVKMTMYDTLEETEVVNTKSLLIHDALNLVSHAISENELSVKSDWYRTPESHWNPGAIRTKANGGNGALKAITNGYHIRGLFTDGETQRNMPLSFKALIESLDAMDCIGWGFSTEDNVLCLRVERWDWFYKDAVILTLDNVAEVTTEVYPDLIPTELKIGYKKFATQDQYNSIDSPHGTRTFVNGIKALSKSITKESEFIADNYAIEETRRARTQVNETEETTYDENIFVFELMRTGPIVPAGGTPIPPSYSIVHSALNASYVGRAEEFINAKLTPRHMAARWRDFLFATNNSTDFRFISGEINYKSSFGTTPEDGVPILGAAYLTAFATRSPQAENDDITNIHAKFKAEKITFSYPISIDDYKTIKANPYGLVSVNGTLGWIMDFKYSFQDGMADFTLIAKNNQVNE